MDPSTPPTEHVSSVTPGMQTSQPTMNETFSQVDGYAEQLRVKLPLAPPGLLNGYMAVVPWIAIIFGILGILVSLAALIGSTILGPLMVMFGAAGSGFALILASLLSLVIAALEVAGGFLMLQRRINGWWLMAVGMVVSLLSSLLHVSAIGLIFWLLIAYIHLQVKPNYR
ncbi:MAG: hypothetical protein JO020_14060 [Chloroflexi bacterium]|nr:hypothetical protein [Chloroflexota bacterium]